mmetsp:Transcript_24455/g.57914  ORF Transcript_24455/g.57914 Transcript_24455/m.57914 type:complete len:207 (+) Transcript_24455:132-752(+)
MPTNPNSLTTADGDDSAPRGTRSTLSHPSTTPPTADPAARPSTDSAIARVSVRFFFRSNQTEPIMASESCTPGASSTPGGCEQPCARTSAASTPSAMPLWVNVSGSGASTAGRGGSLFIMSLNPGGSFCFTAAPGLSTSAYFTVLSETSPCERFMRLLMRTTSYAASTIFNFSSWSPYRVVIWFFALTMSSDDAFSLRPRNLSAPW